MWNINSWVRCRKEYFGFCFLVAMVTVANRFLSIRYVEIDGDVIIEGKKECLGKLVLTHREFPYSMRIF